MPDSAALLALLVALAAGAAVLLPAARVSDALVFASFLSGIAIPIGGFNIRPEQVAGPLFAAALLVRPRVGPLPRATLLVAAWVLLGLVSSFGEPEADRALLHTVRLGATVLPVFILPALLVTERDAARAWNGFLVLATLEGAVGLLCLGSHVAFGTSFGVFVEEYLFFVHPQGTLLEPNLLGALSAAALVPLLLRMLDPARHRRERWLTGLASLVLLAALVTSLTRMAWLALLVSFALVLALKGDRRLVRRLVLATAVVVALGAFLLRERLSERMGVTGKITSLSRIDEDPNVRIRLRTYTAALDLWTGAPLGGRGHGAMERMPGTEDKAMAWVGNLPVHLLADTGVLGLALVLGFVGIVLLRLVRTWIDAGSSERKGAALERLGALSVLLICSQATETSWLASFWVLFGLAWLPARRGADRRILYVHPSDELYGSDRVLLELVRRLPERFAPSVLLSSDVAYAGRLSARLSALGVPVTRMRIGVLRRQALSSPVRVARYGVDVAVSTLRIAWLLRRERIDVVHANTVTVFPAAFAALLAGKPLVWHIHEIVTDRAGRAVLQALVRALATRLVVVSEAARASIGGREAIVVPNGIERVEESAPCEGPPVIAYVGRLSRRKGPDVLLDAFARVAAEHPSARLVFAGDEFGGGDALGDELRGQAERLGVAARVEFRPFREEISDLLREASVVVSPSILPESFGLVLLEAMAHGRPVIASRHGGPAELVVDGETGTLVPPGDRNALAKALGALLSDPAGARRMGDAARERARERYDIDASVARFVELYDAL